MVKLNEKNKATKITIPALENLPNMLKKSTMN